MTVRLLDPRFLPDLEMYFLSWCRYTWLYLWARDVILCSKQMRVYIITCNLHVEIVRAGIFPSSGGILGSQGTSAHHN